LRKIWYPDIPFTAVLESHASVSLVCVTAVVWRFGGTVGDVSAGGGGEHGAVAAESVATADRFCAVSAASTPNV
jgi:hypothetical protein